LVAHLVAHFVPSHPSARDPAAVRLPLLTISLVEILQELAGQVAELSRQMTLGPSR
jgi:hypothetical protein